MSARLRPGHDAGFTMVETLIATALMVVMTAAVFSFVNPRALLAEGQPEASDMQQRVRVAGDVLLRDFLAAGAGLDAGPDAGPLGAFLPPIVPRRMGLTGADADGVARADAVTLIWLPGGGAQTTANALVSSASPTLSVNAQPGCPFGDALCGLAEGADAVLFDDQAHFDVFRVTRVQGTVAEVALHGGGPSHEYQPGARVASAITRIYYLDAANRQLRAYDGYLNDTPVIDNVVGLSFSYFGDPSPPVAPRPTAGTANCLYDIAGQPLGAMVVLTPTGGSLAPLPLSMLNDGPWCGENGSRFDADLLRVRQVRVTVRVQAGPDKFRGLGAQFAVPGTSHRSEQALPDYTLTFDVAPRNMRAVVR